MNDINTHLTHLETTNFFSNLINYCSKCPNCLCLACVWMLVIFYHIASMGMVIVGISIENAMIVTIGIILFVLPVTILIVIFLIWAMVMCTIMCFSRFIEEIKKIKNGVEDYDFNE